ATGQMIAGPGVSTGTMIIGGSGTTWTVNNSQTAESENMISIAPANAAVTATNANVYLDNQPYVNYLTGLQKYGFYADLTPITPPNETIIFPAGSFAGSGRINVRAQAGWTIKGQGQLSTTLYAPKGVYPLHLFAATNTGYTLSDFTLQGNFGLDKF